VDLNKRGVKWLQCVHTAPCGVATDRALSAFGKVTTHPVSYEANASSVVAKLVAGEVDAAFIYHTDFIAHSSALKEIWFSDTPSTKTLYAIGVVSDGKSKGLAQEFMKYILSSKSLALLVRAGFTKVSV
jgi:molybdate transport system substrate-binding protein